MSRTRKKKAAQGLQALGERLVELPEEQLQAVPIFAELAEAIAMARTMHKHGARRRQLQYIGALMREIDPEPIENALEALTRGDRGEVRRFKQAEAWRDALLAGDGTVLAAIQANCPEADLDRVDQLVVEVRAAKAKPVRKRAARSLFRYLKKSITTS
ncbi:MAG: ribosome biogenesis factor YjgA [Desulfosarcinaceae bacterium]